MKEKSLRKHLLQPLARTFFLLWLGTMVLLTSATCQELETTVKLSAQNIRTTIEEYREYYKRNIDSGLGAEADHILINNISALSLGQVNSMDGGVAIIMRTYNMDYVRSQLTWGYGHQDGIDLDDRWYFYFDQGLDDKGQIAFANWLIDHRKSWDYTIYPMDEELSAYDAIADGTFARITGIEHPGHRIDIQKIEIVHPDGTVETMVETTTEGIGQTWDFRYINIASVLLPSYNNRGDGTHKDGYVNMERRLNAYRAAHARAEDRLDDSHGYGAYTEGGGDFYTMGVSDPDGKVSSAAMYYDTLPAAMRQERGLYISTALLTLIVLFVLSAKLSEKVTAPVEQLCSETTDGRCRTDRDIAELNTLAAAFNEAQEKVEQQLERERAFTRAAAHELKTPLAILRAHAECAMEDIAPDKRGEYLNIVLEESDRMAELVSALLTLSRLDSHNKPTMETVELAPILQRAAESFAPMAEQKGIVLTTELSDLQVNGNDALLHKIISNLLSNALRHTPAGGTVVLRLHEQEGSAVLTVDNDGEPIPEEHLPRLFEPFYRVDTARNRTDGGTGLGLTIVRAAVLAHGGSCEVCNREGGVQFKLTIPK